MKPSLLLLAAGMGSRYGGLKQIDAFGPNGESILDYSLYDAIRIGFEKIVFIIREEIREDFVSFFEGKFPDHIEVHYVAQDLNDIPEGYKVPEGRVKPWGTAHAVYAARNVINEPFTVINADDYYGYDALKTIFHYLSELRTSDPQRMTTVSYHLANTLSDHGQVNRGICAVNENSELVSVTERKGISRKGTGEISCDDPDDGVVILAEDSLASMNMYGLTSLFFKRTEEMLIEFLRESGGQLKSELYIPAVVTDLIHSENMIMDVLESPSEWFGVTYQDDKPFVQDKINNLIKREVYPSKLWV